MLQVPIKTSKGGKPKQKMKIKRQGIKALPPINEIFIVGF
jgi:hypothetical protein